MGVIMWLRDDDNFWAEVLGIILLLLWLNGFGV